MHEIKFKRVYEPIEKGDGFRILIDRLWPRGLSKEKGHINLWLKEIAPSATLRKSFNHESGKWKEFVEKYHKELEASEAVDEVIKFIKKHKNVTLLYAARGTQHNNAIVLQDFLEKKLPN